jgi:hypothetical protein
VGANEVGVGDEKLLFPWFGMMKTVVGIDGGDGCMTM